MNEESNNFFHNKEKHRTRTGLKKCIAMLLVIANIFYMTNLTALADTKANYQNDVISGSGYYVNPIYANEENNSDIYIPGTLNSSTASDDVTYYTDVDKAAEELCEKSKDRESDIKIGFRMSEASSDEYLSKALAIWKKIFKHTGVSDEGDYLYAAYSSVRYGYSGTYVNDGIELIFKYQPKWKSTKAQEDELDVAIDNLEKQWDFDGKSDYEIIATIYKYICDNVTYDYENLNDSSYSLKFTAFAALINKTAVCEGYATLLYRLLLDYNIDNRVVAKLLGKGKSGHAWNLIKLGDYYYYADSTWDSD